MKPMAIVSAHIWLDDEGNKEFEPLTIIHNDEKGTGIFDDIDHALLDGIDIKDSIDYYFIAIVESEFVEHRYWEGTEWDVEHNVREIKSISDVTIYPPMVEKE